MPETDVEESELDSGVDSEVELLEFADFEVEEEGEGPTDPEGPTFSDRLRGVAEDFAQRGRERLRRFQATPFGSRTSKITRPITTPRRFEEKIEKADLGDQLTALVILPFIIPFTLAFIEVFNDLLAGIMLANNPGAIAEFFVTALTLGAFVFAAWTWFIWVRVGGLAALE